MSPARTITHTYKDVEVSNLGHLVMSVSGGRNGSKRADRQMAANLTSATEIGLPSGKMPKALFTPSKVTPNGVQAKVVVRIGTPIVNVTSFDARNNVLLVTVEVVTAVSKEDRTVTTETIFTNTNFLPNWMEGVPEEYVALVNATMDKARTRFATKATFIAAKKEKAITTGATRPTGSNLGRMAALAASIVSNNQVIQRLTAELAAPSVAGFPPPNPFATPPQGPAFG